MADPVRYFLDRYGVANTSGEKHVARKAALAEAQAALDGPPDRGKLVAALHAIRHEHSDLWPPQDGCGCAEWAEAVIAHWR